MAVDAVFQEETKALEKTEQIIDYAATKLENEIAEQQQRIDNFACVDYSDRQELAELSATTRKQQERADELRGYQDSPYFGRMDLDVVDESDTEVVYVGKTGIYLDGEFLVSDWRSPLGQYFYMKSERNFHAGQTDYVLQLRRALDVKGGQLISYRTEFDGETVSLEGDVIDPFLLTVLKDKRRQNRLTDIIKTIQSNQNDIIRRPRTESFIVQGCAGSGKTMILLHRLSYLMFNHRDMSLDNIKIITPNVLFDAHINELSSELGLNRIERKSVEEFYVSLIKGFSRKIDVSSEVSSEKGLNSQLLRTFYSEKYFDDAAAHYDSYWNDVLAQIDQLNIAELATRLSIEFKLPTEHSYVAYDNLTATLHSLRNSISEKTKQQNRLVKQIEYYRNELATATEENARCLKNLIEITNTTKAFVRESLRKQTEQLMSLNSTAASQKGRISLWEHELQKLKGTSKKKHEHLSAVQNDIIHLTDYQTISKRTDAIAVGLLSALSRQEKEIKQLEAAIQNTAFHDSDKKNELQIQLTNELKRFSKLAMDHITVYLDLEFASVAKIDHRIAELQQNLDDKTPQFEHNQQVLANIKHEAHVLSLCNDLFIRSLCPDLHTLDANVLKNMPDELNVYDETFKQSSIANQHLENIRNALIDLENQYKAIDQLHLSEADTNSINSASALVEKLRLNDISRNVMMKDMREAYRSHNEIYSRANYRHKLYIKLLFCYLYYKKISGNHGLFINIDEAQDISIPEYRLMRLILGSQCIFNLYGDVNQLVYDYKGIANWSEIAQEISNNVFTLNENYRNTLEITNFCNKEFNADVYPIGISGNDVQEQTLSDALAWIFQSKKHTPSLRAAIIYRYGHSGITDALREAIVEQNVSWFKIVSDKVAILSVENAKGLEFDCVVAVVDSMTENEKYISYTRALDSLSVVREHFEYSRQADTNAAEDNFEDELLIDEMNDSETEVLPSLMTDNNKQTPDSAGSQHTSIPQTNPTTQDEELLNAVSTIITEAFGEDQSLSDEQRQIIQLLSNRTNLACTAPSGWKKSIILFAIAKYVHENTGMQSILTAEGHLQENELVLAEKMGLRAGSITDNMSNFLADFKKEKYDIIFVPYDFFAYENNVAEFIQYFSEKLAYWGIDHPSEEPILWNQLKQTSETLQVTPFLMSRNGFQGLDLSEFAVVNVADDSEPIEHLIHTVSLTDAENKKTWLVDHADEMWGQGLVYCNTETECKEISKLLRKKKVKAEAYIHVSDQKNTERINYLSNSFSKGGLPVLVTTQSAGKNLSNPNIRFIVHYSVPEDSSLYTAHIAQIGKLSEKPVVYDLKHNR